MCSRKTTYTHRAHIKSSLQNQPKRRVADLLANYIPEDEALLLRDGRYACTVCFHRPVFDTLDMLTVHRSGKRHLASLQKFYGKKRSLENEVQKRHHQAYLRAEEAGAQATPGPAPLLVQTRKIAQNALLKTTPYNSCCRRSREVRSDPRPSPSRSSTGSRDPKEEVLSKPRNSTQTGENRSVGVEVAPTARLPESTNITADSPKQPTPGKKHSHKRKGLPVEAPPTNFTPEKRQALEHYLRLKSSGWVQDGSGNWVKDENVEFDSDEEEPPALVLDVAASKLCS